MEKVHTSLETRPWAKYPNELPLSKALGSLQTGQIQANKNRVLTVFWGKARPQSTGAGRAEPAPTCTTKIKSREKCFKDKETLTKEQEDHRGTSTSQDQTANSNLPSSWRAPLQIPCCLETAGSRSMDNGSNYARLPTRTLQDSSHEIDLPDFIPLAGASGSVGPRSARAPEQECNRDLLKFGWFSQPRVCSAEKGRGVATNHQSESPKLLPQHSALQDGKYLYHQRYFERGRLYGQDRSQRRLFQCEDPSSPQEIFEISVERNYLPVQSSPLWLSHSPQSVLQDYAGSNKSRTGEGSTSSAVSR